jgi:hypothetical protein
MAAVGVRRGIDMKKQFARVSYDDERGGLWDLEIDDQFTQQPAALRAEILRELLEAVHALHANAVEDVNKQVETQRQ